MNVLRSIFIAVHRLSNVRRCVATASEVPLDLHRLLPRLPDALTNTNSKLLCSGKGTLAGTWGVVTVLLSVWCRSVVVTVKSDDSNRILLCTRSFEIPTITNDCFLRGSSVCGTLYSHYSKSVQRKHAWPKMWAHKKLLHFIDTYIFAFMKSDI